MKQKKRLRKNNRRKKKLNTLFLNLIFKLFLFFQIEKSGSLTKLKPNNEFEIVYYKIRSGISI